MPETVSEGEFFKNIKEEVNLKQAINRKVLRFPFLEEAAWKIFSKKISVLKKDRLLGLGLINERFHLEYKFLIKTQQQKLDKVRFDQPISVIRKITSDRISTFDFPRFEVYRKGFEDVNDYFSFSEADFPLLTLEDVLKVYDHCMISIRKPEPVQLAKRAIVRFMKTMIDITGFQDFQIGIESGKKRINLSKPNQFLEGLENHHLCDVIEEPELGVVLQNGEMKRIFIRCTELNKYSSGTLELMVDLLTKQMKYEKAIKRQQSWEPRIEKALVEINKRLKFRMLIREFERCLGQRPRKFFKFPSPQ